MRCDGRPFSIPSAFGRVLNSKHPTAHPPTRPFFTSHVVNKRRAPQGPLKDMSMDTPSSLLQRFDDLHRRGRTVCSKPFHDPIRLLTVGFALIAPSGRASHGAKPSKVHIKACLTGLAVAGRQRGR